MSMPIQRQSESYGIFDDGPRFARDRQSRDLPAGLAGLINTTGPRIQAGLLNTRQAAPAASVGEGGADMGTIYSQPAAMNVGGTVSTSLPGAIGKMVWNGSTMTGQETTPAFNPGPAKTGGWHNDFDPTARLRIRRAGMECEYCGKPGHDWTRHPEAHADVAAWEREKHGLEFPFGDHREGDYPADDDHGGEYWPGRNARLAGIPDDDPMPMTPDEEDQWEREQAGMARRNREWNQRPYPPGTPKATVIPWDQAAYDQYIKEWHDRRQGSRLAINVDDPGRNASRRVAVNTDGMDPSSHAYHQESYGGAYDSGGRWVGDDDEGYYAPKRQWNPDFGYEMTDEDIRNHELEGEDDDSGYNWGPEPTGIPDSFIMNRDARRGRHPFDRAAGRRLAKDGGCTCWEGYERVPGTEPCADGSCRRKVGANTWQSSRLGGGYVRGDRPATKDMFDRVRDETGIQLSTGIAGGCGNYLGRLEDGSWLYVTDAHETMQGPHAEDLSLRKAHEAEHGPLGWYVAIHPNEYDEDFERRYPGHGNGAASDPVHEHIDETALTADLPRVIQKALSTMPHGQGGGDRAPGLDYESLVNPRDDLSDGDYGDIFGGSR